MSKEYIDQAVQTEPPRHLSRSDNPRSLNVHPIADAYNRPKKPSQLGQISKPSESALPTRRIVSLPESSPPHRLIPTNERYRVASMSDAHPIKTVKISTSADSSLSSECFESSVSLDSRFYSDLYGNRPQSNNSLTNVAFSYTPSPPSSPESSIMIIGNNVQVSNNFLRTRPKIDYDDKQDWTTWADSPPRPIPALHGPLSLPYARCPSGAEGILVEGEDLSHMIWGLRQDESNFSGPRDPLEAKAAVKRSPDAPATRESTQPYHYLKTPSSLASSFPAFKFRENDAYRPSPQPLTSRDTDPWWYEYDDSDDSPIIIPPTPQQLKNFLELQRVFESAHPDSATGDRGLGLFWPGQKTGHLETDALPRQLQTSSPNWQTSDIIPISNPGAAARRRSISAIDIATEYVSQQQAKNSLITPPNSTSTQWTSRFPDVSPLLSDDRLQAALCDDFEEDQSGRHQCVLYLDQMNPRDHLLVQDQATRRDAASKDPSNKRPDDHSPNTICVSVDSHSTTSPGSGSGPAANLILPKPQLLELRTGTARSTGPPPRSVPFARLLQHRLSAVPEEKSSIRMQPFSNTPIPQPLRMRRPGFQNGAQAPNKPYFAQASQNHLDSSHKVLAPPSSPVSGRSRLLTASAVVSSLNTGSKPIDSGSNPSSPVPNVVETRVSKENVAAKRGDGVSKKRGRNRAKKQESSVSKAAK